jgi:two-component system sensor histidine kinase VicK
MADHRLSTTEIGRLPDGEHGEDPQALARFLGLIAHELRGPLGIASGYVSLLRDGALGQLPEPANQALPIIASKLNRMASMVSQLADASRLDDENYRPRTKRVDLRELVSEVVQTEAVEEPRRNFSVEAPEHPLIVDVDTTRVSDIVRNLLDNAVKYSPHGGEVTCSVRSAGGDAQVTVRDEGIGIADSDMPSLFTPLGRVENKASAGIPGTGLGLYLSREFARVHGGDITAESGSRGTAFTLSLPLAA